MFNDNIFLLLQTVSVDSGRFFGNVDEATKEDERIERLRKDLEEALTRENDRLKEIVARNERNRRQNKRTRSA
jgi:hypothetical protein